MANGNIYIKASIERYMILFIPLAKYERVEDISVLSVLGFRVYERIGSAKALFGFIISN